MMLFTWKQRELLHLSTKLSHHLVCCFSKVDLAVRVHLEDVFVILIYGKSSWERILLSFRVSECETVRLGHNARFAFVSKDVEYDTAEVLFGQGVPAAAFNQVQEFVHLWMASPSKLF